MRKHEVKEYQKILADYHQKVSIMDSIVRVKETVCTSCFVLFITAVISKDQDTVRQKYNSISMKDVGRNVL